MKFETVIPFCTYDKNFIDRVIDGVRNISSNIYIVYSDKLFDGTEEDVDYIENLKIRNKDCVYIKNIFNSDMSSRWNHNNARWNGYKKTDTKIPYVLFLNADEIFDKNKLKLWIENKKIFEDAIYFANYWYFRDEKYQAKTLEETPVLVNKNIIIEPIMYTEDETNIFKYIKDINVSTMTMGLDNLPMCHHYSWVLNKEEMLKKTKSWGHKNDRDWSKLIEEEFSRDFNGTDFVHGYEYNIL